MRHRCIRDIMSTRQVQCGPRASVREAARIMAENRICCVLVTEHGRLTGIFTENDAVYRVLAQGRDPDTTLIEDVMSPDPDTIGPGERVEEAIRRMDEFGYSHLPVMEGGRLVGLLSIRDCSINDLAGMAYELERRKAVAERAW